MQHRHDEDIADINMVLDGREDPVATHTTISLEQMPPSFTGGKKKTHAQKMKEQDAAFLSHMKERADATAKFRAEIMATTVTPTVSSPKKLDSSRSGFCNWFESVAESLHPSLWPRSERRDYYTKKDEACMKLKEVMSIIIMEWISQRLTFHTLRDGLTKGTYT
ncbi:uncharacterized protein [Mytilus edulis]|uniref:uncharacterized protein isoform X2 n=1 Tax=Mytilus edulis TaxID=6550 RepID=UPI0039EF9DA1